MKKNFYKIVAIVVSVFLTMTTLAQAHELQTDGNVGAVMHIDPDDNPIINAPAGFFFEFKDRQNLFDDSKCSCKANIFSNGQEIFSTFLSPNIFQYAFLQKGSYLLEVSGQPINGSRFQSFHLRYEIAVTDKPKFKSSYLTEHFLHGIIFGGGLLLATVLATREEIKHRRKLKRDKIEKFL